MLNGWLLALGGLPKIGWLALLYMEVPWATAPLTIVLGDLMFRRPVRVRRIVRTLLASLAAMIVSQVFLRGILLVVVVVMPSRFPFLNEVILLEQEPVRRERKSIYKQIKRARSLTTGDEVDLFTRWLGQLFLGTTFRSAC